MYLKSMVVQVDNSGANRGRLQIAFALAARKVAHLTGCYAVPALNPVVYSSGTALSGVYQDALEAIEQDAVKAEADFREEARARGIDHDWMANEGSAAGHLIVASRYADLTIVGQYDPDDAHGAESGIPESLALESGRPVLVVPYIGAGESAGERILIAWDGSRESARAVNDAMPLLAAASRVDVLHLHQDDLPADTLSPARRLAGSLKRNGVDAHAEEFNIGDGDIGNALLSRAADLGANLIVMGAYGHSRFREMVLGGATHDLLKHMTVPVLMAH